MVNILKARIDFGHIHKSEVSKLVITQVPLQAKSMKDSKIFSKRQLKTKKVLNLSLIKIFTPKFSS